MIEDEEAEDVDEDYWDYDEEKPKKWKRKKTDEY